MRPFPVSSKENWLHHQRERCKRGGNIALSGASVILSSDRQPLPPFRRNANLARYNLANELISVVTPELVPRDTIRDE
jgi:hypothetical protein